ncbi:L,D-transpeptidase [Paenibacillus sp. 11B]|uniref:L,D-transpeptidase family protein n=1 Tax=unclassified Paenibacillus TaxID=185978 RepID=UPI00264E4D66|nr:L,D-transpeptidase [Paenibacillus sp. 11B]MDN8589872.1 L,D-transpeptidase [Paenibacillus sp. 11B]
MQNTHLRTYVKKHPDNKMAWYLLGKEYLGEGQEAKANYCFQQAGEVYEAFERSKAPADIWVDYQEKLVEVAEQKEKKHRVRKMWLTLLMLLVLAGLPPADAPGFNRDAADVLASALEPTDDSTDKSGDSPADDPAPVVNSNVFTAAAFGGGDQGEAALAAAWSGSGPKVQTSAVLGMQVAGNWTLWKRNMSVKYIVQTNSNGKLTAQSYDAKQCNCEPPEVSQEIKRLAQAWTAKQESAAALSSAMITYKKQNGTWPKNVAQLAQPFPDNILGETAPGMTRLFPALLAIHQQGERENGKNRDEGTREISDSTQGKNTAFVDTLGEKPFLQDRLEIIVDKSRHKLALISGNTIIRNYEVGLGGDRTPEGSFVISDKVVNPNGRSNGEFGSRGMQLSDTNYAIHGTNEPNSIGLDESLGCVRMSTEDVEELFALAPQGTPVRIGKDLLPETAVIPEAKNRYRYTLVPKQSNPNKTYHWLN